LSLFRGYSGKILDIQHATTTSAGTVDISAILEKGVEVMVIKAKRVGGTGNLNIYPNSGTDSVALVNSHMTVGVIDGVLKYKNTVKNDDWDVWCYGYWIKVPVQHLRQRRGQR